MVDKPTMSDIMKAVSNMQSSMQATQEQLESTHLTGTAGMSGDSTDISITINGRFSCLDCQVTETFKQQSPTVMSELIKRAINDAVEQVGEATRKHIETLSQDLR
jgi:DNA-binding protein YbaB